MNILHFTPVYAPAWQYGGPVLSVSRLCEGLVDLGAHVRVITTNAGLSHLPQESLGKPQTINGVEVTYYKSRNYLGYIYSQHLVADLPLHMEWASILHLSSIWQPLGLPVQRAACRYGVPRFQSLRGALGPYSLKHGWCKKLPYYLLFEYPYLQGLSSIHCTTPQEHNEISRLHLKAPVSIIPNPINLAHLQFSELERVQVRARLNIQSDETLFIVVGRQHHKKGLDLLPATLNTLPDSSWRILFVGDDDDGTGLWLRRQLAHYRLADKCIWLNSLPSDSLAGLYNAADWLLLPSRHENFGNVVVEALACGCGALLSDMVGSGDLLKHCPGVSISPRSVKVWARNLKQALNQSRPGHFSSSFVQHVFSKETVAKQFLDLYSSIA